MSGNAHYAALPHEPGNDGTQPTPLAVFAARFRSDAESAPLRVPAADAPPDRATVRCTSTECVGAALCVHVTLDAPPSDDAAEAFALYTVVESPVGARTLARVHALLSAGAAPADLQRAGATASVLASLGITLADLVSLHGYPLEDVVAGLALDWRRLLMLNFHWVQLKAHDVFPLSVLAPLIGDGERLLDTFDVTYRQLASALDASALLVLNIDAALARVLGARRLDMAALTLDAEMVQHGGVKYTVRAFALTPALFAAMPHTSADFDAAPHALKCAYAALTSLLLHEQ